MTFDEARILASTAGKIRRTSWEGKSRVLQPHFVITVTCAVYDDLNGTKGREIRPWLAQAPDYDADDWEVLP